MVKRVYSMVVEQFSLNARNTRAEVVLGSLVSSDESNDGFARMTLDLPVTVDPSNFLTVGERELGPEPVLKLPVLRSKLFRVTVEEIEWPTPGSPSAAPG